MSLLLLHLFDNKLNFIPTVSSITKLFLFVIISKSCGAKNLSQSCVPIGSHLKIYSAPNIANIYDFKFLLIVFIAILLWLESQLWLRIYLVKRIKLPKILI